MKKWIIFSFMSAAAVAEAPSPRTRIQQAARARFERFGFRRTGVSEIARDAGVAAGTLYRYFRSKEDIFLQVLAAENEEWLACAQRQLYVLALERQIAAVEPEMTVLANGNWEIEFFDADRYNEARRRALRRHGEV